MVPEYSSGPVSTSSAASCPINHTSFDHNSSELSEDSVWAAYSELRSEAPVARSPHHGGYVVLSRYADVKAALKDPGTFRSGNGHRIPEVGTPRVIPLDYDGQLHKDYRAAMARAVEPRRVRTLQPFVTTAVEELVAAFHDAGGGDVVAAISLPLPLRVLTRIVGFAKDTVTQFRTTTERMWERINEVDYDEARREIRALIDAEIARHRAEDIDDYITELLGMTVEDRPIDDDDVARILISLAVAGHETTMNATSSMFWLLASDPALQKRIRTDPTTRPAFVEEVLRVRSPVQNLARQTTREVEVDGRIVPAQTSVLLSYAAANRDGSEFSHPDEVDLEQSSRRHLAFGFGIHQCIGAPLVRAEMVALLAAFAARPRIVLDGEATFEGLQGGMHFGPTRVPLRFAADT